MVDLDGCAHITGRPSRARNKPVLICWYFSAAFPCAASEFMKTAIRNMNMHEGFRNIIDGIHHMSSAVVNNAVNNSREFLCGVLQGCPLSGLIFSRVLAPMLLAIETEIDDEGWRAPALSPMTLVINTISTYAQLFDIIDKTCGLTLESKKCQIAPLWTTFSSHTVDSVRQTLAVLSPLWCGFNVVCKALCLVFLARSSSCERRPIACSSCEM